MRLWLKYCYKVWLRRAQEMHETIALLSPRASSLAALLPHLHIARNLPKLKRRQMKGTYQTITLPL